jgi:hypothetical protein
VSKKNRLAHERAKARRIAERDEVSWHRAREVLRLRRLSENVA